LLNGLLKIPYRLLWRIFRRLGPLPLTVVYCAEPMDYVILKPVLKHMPPLPFVVKNRRTRSYLKSMGLDVRRWPVFPLSVIMCRHAAALFPEPRIVKIGFRHGAYHFKKFTRPGRYNAFDLYFVTSRREEEEAKAAGIRCAFSGGYPKLDPAFDGSTTPAFLDRIRAGARTDPAKPTILFTATYDGSGMSAVGRWIGRLERFSRSYNVWVTVHPWISAKYVSRLKKLGSVFFIEDYDILPYIVACDVLVGDMSSVLAEGCALNKPMVTFRVPAARRTPDDVAALIGRFSLRIDTADELDRAVETCLEDPAALQGARMEAKRIFFESLDGKAGMRCALKILDMTKRLS
jgi:CDP-glycerol glycerophosphotransferase (TagB/SpsB family)